MTTDAMSSARLADPDADQRLTALRELAAWARPAARRGTNVHVHTNHSFSVFRSPCEAAWHAAQAGVEVFGITDFFTTAGMAEFGAACAILRLPAVHGLECIAMDRDLEAGRTLMNDPGNPGKIYLTGKGVTRPDDPAAARTLATIRGYQESRNRQLVARADAHFRATIAHPGPTWDDVAGQTPLGNTTERHVARAILQHLDALAGQVPDAYARVVGAPAKGAAPDQQNQIRANLLKAGKPCYAPEHPDAFPPVAALRELYLQLGAIPTYPVLGNPITDGERDIRALCDRIAAWGFSALELIPPRNTDERVADVIAEAQRRGWPVFDGTEHNTAAMEPLLTTWGMDGRFRDAFRDGACVALGHQAFAAAGHPGYLGTDGLPRPGGYGECLALGRQAVVAV